MRESSGGRFPAIVWMITMPALLAAVSYILAFLEFPVPLSPAFARMDLSDFPALVGAFAFGPVSGIIIELVKNGLQLLSTSTGGVGEFANFFIGASFVGTAGLVYRLHKTKRMAWAACVVSSIIMGIVAAIANYFLLLPMFEIFMPLEQVIASFGAFIPFIRTKLDVYRQVMEQQFIAVSATKDKAAVSLRGKVKNIGSEKLDEIFERNVYMRKIYPGDTRTALEVFCVYEAEGEYFDISNPSHVVRDSIVIGEAEVKQTGYFAGQDCIGCKLCYSVCPQKCIDISGKPVVIDQNRCLHCGRCAEICPKQAIRYVYRESSAELSQKRR